MKRRRMIDAEEALVDAHRYKLEADQYKAQARRLTNALRKQKLEHDSELLALQRTNDLLMNWNAGLALELAATRFENSELKGQT